MKLIAGAMVASSSPAAVSWLYYANRLYELPLGVASIAVAAVLMPTIAATVRSAQPEAIAAAQSRGFELGLGLALPAATAFALLAQPIAAGLFERGAFDARDTAAVAAALTAICAGLPGHVLEKVLGAVSFAHEDARTPMLAALAGLATALAGALVLFPRYGHVGVAAAIAISGWVGATLLGAILLAARLASLRPGGGATAAADRAGNRAHGRGARRRAGAARLDARRQRVYPGTHRRADAPGRDRPRRLSRQPAGARGGAAARPRRRHPRGPEHFRKVDTGFP